MNMGRNIKETPEAAPIEAVKADRYVTRVELARILKVSVRKVDSMIAGKEIPVLRLGKAVRFRLVDVERRLDEAMESNH
jgi:excisionase family DNA binding protein